jgi:hypothetical protein
VVNQTTCPQINKGQHNRHLRDDHGLYVVKLHRQASLHAIHAPPVLLPCSKGQIFAILQYIVYFAEQENTGKKVQASCTIPVLVPVHSKKIQVSCTIPVLVPVHSKKVQAPIQLQYIVRRYRARVSYQR